MTLNHYSVEIVV